MWIMMILSYTTVSFLDLKLTRGEKSKGQIFLYICLMAISCIIGTANGYVLNMPSPAEPLRRIVFSILGK